MSTGMIMTDFFYFFLQMCLAILMTTIGTYSDELKCTESNSSAQCCSGFRKINRKCEECIGFFGEGCTRSCPPGFYGRRCRLICNCAVNETCNQFVGCRSNSTCDLQQNVEQHDLIWQLLITLLCVQGLISVLCISYSLRKRM
ncbi:scavenger receptor class F member 1-like [Crassostrea angulata]|uniref:scavenger receptor class F member 1-like n=1 Tax=Magallana angulata TaxID=2784310 RepID=UPI0022B0B0DB|nr:scavenger receptor class F member 1-like [Crassostrea angulata]